jgi:hypothetical protein
MHYGFGNIESGRRWMCDLFHRVSCFFQTQIAMLAWFCVDCGIAAGAGIGYNLPVNKKLSSLNFSLRSKADRESYQKMGICPFFFCSSGFASWNVAIEIQVDARLN